jgi:peptidoglycan hydrolase-like protein with peptidoglycan-binding domain
MITLQRNATGSWVRELQRLLSAQGFALTNDGIFGGKTEGFVRQFQQWQQLTVDGVVTEAVWGALGWKSNVEEKRLADRDILAVANDLGVEVAAIKAVYVIESRGKGFLPDGRPKILFEGHIFWL